MIKILFNLLAAMLVTGIAVAQDNLAINGGFELSTNGETVPADNPDLLEGWQILFEGAEATFMIQDLTVYEGSLALSANVTTLGPDPWSVQAINWPVPTEEDDELYRATLMVYTLTPGLNMSFTAGLWSGYPEKGRIGQEADPVEVPFAQWTKLSFTFIPELDSARIPIHFHTTGMHYIDDLQIIHSSFARCEIDESGDTLIMDFGWSVKEPDAAFDLSNIQLTVDGNKRNIESLHYDTKTMAPWRNILKANIAGRVGEGSTVTITCAQDATHPLEYLPNPDFKDPAFVPADKIPRISNEPVDNKSLAVGVRSFAAVPGLVYYVNEGRDLLVVEGLEDASLVDIYSITGQLMRSKRADGFRETMGIQDLAPGVYVLSVRFADNSRFSAKFLK